MELWRQREGVLVRRTASGSVLSPAAHSEIIVLDHAATAVWAALETAGTTAAVAARVATVYDLAPEELHEDVARSLALFEAAGAVSRWTP